MFVDSVKILVSSGKGGAGCSSFRREKFVVKGGPDGGDGGRGGDLTFLVSQNTDTLAWYKGKNILRAENGKAGMGRNMTGKSASALKLIVPPGTQVFDDDTNELLLDLLELDKEYTFLEGGKGGLGNTHFKNSRNQRPTYFQPGLKGVEKNIRLELKLIADTGLLAFPNVGKSTLISTISNARPEIANYEFTTLTPKLGLVEVGEYSSFLMADIPGIIGGASEGKGLGLKFLKHIERTKTLLFMIDISSYRDIYAQFETLKKEISHFSDALAQKPFGLVFTKIDTKEDEEVNTILKDFTKSLGLKLCKENSYGFDEKLNYFTQDMVLEKFDQTKPFFILPISSVTHRNIKPLRFVLYDLIGLLK